MKRGNKFPTLSISSRKTKWKREDLRINIAIIVVFVLGLMVIGIYLGGEGVLFGPPTEAELRIARADVNNDGTISLTDMSLVKSLDGVSLDGCCEAKGGLCRPEGFCADGDEHRGQLDCGDGSVCCNDFNNPGIYPIDRRCYADVNNDGTVSLTDMSLVKSLDGASLDGSCGFMSGECRLEAECEDKHRRILDCADGEVCCDKSPVIEEDIGELEYVRTLTDDDCGLIYDLDCNLFVAEYSYVLGGVDTVNAAVEVHDNGFSNEEFISAFNKLAGQEGFQIEEGSYDDNNFLILSKGVDVMDYVVAWYNGKNVVAVLIEGWNTTFLDDDVFDGLLEAYLQKYPSELEFLEEEIICGNGKCENVEFVLQEGETSTISFKDSVFEFEIYSISADSVRLSVNGEVTADLGEGDFFSIGSENVRIQDIFYRDIAGFVNSVELVLGEFIESCPEDCGSFCDGDVCTLYDGDDLDVRVNDGIYHFHLSYVDETEVEIEVDGVSTGMLGERDQAVIADIFIEVSEIFFSNIKGFSYVVLRVEHTEGFNCVDSDNGLNFSEKGYASGTIYDGSVRENVPDECVDGTRLLEWFCSDNTLSLYYHDCPDGCYDGRCAREVCNNDGVCDIGESFENCPSDCEEEQLVCTLDFFKGDESVDRHIIASGTSWADVHGKQEGSVASGYYSRIGSSPTIISRAFLPFDTRSLPFGVIIKEAKVTLNVNSQTYANNDNDGDDFLVLVRSSQDYMHALYPKDFGHFYPVELSDRVDISGYNPGDVIEFALDTSQFAQETDGWTKLGIREGHDFLNNEPNGLNEIAVDSSALEGAPKLSISYTTGSASENVCDDGIDNDCDGKVDGEDCDCEHQMVCGDGCCDSGEKCGVDCEEEVCGDGVDNDEDGEVDEGCEPSNNCIWAVLHGDPSDKIDLLFIGDEYPDINSYRNAVLGSLDFFGKLDESNSFMNVEPYKSNQDKFNVWIMPETYSLSLNSVGGWYYFDDNEVNEIISNCPQADIINIISRKRFRPYAYFSGRTYNSFCLNWGTNKNTICSEDPIVDMSYSRLLLHEFGHAFGQLRDEYIEPPKGDISGEPNCAPDMATAQSWWGDVSGAYYFNGCSYILGNIRPTENSLMRDNWDISTVYGPVNERRLLERLGGYS